jgi:hypothetical protein
MSNLDEKEPLGSLDRLACKLWHLTNWSSGRNGDAKCRPHGRLRPIGDAKCRPHGRLGYHYTYSSIDYMYGNGQCRSVTHATRNLGT